MIASRHFLIFYVYSFLIVIVSLQYSLLKVPAQAKSIF